MRSSISVIRVFRVTGRLCVCSVQAKFELLSHYDTSSGDRLIMIDYKLQAKLKVSQVYK